MRKLRADGRRQTIPHGAKPARRQPSIGIVKPIELSRPHLVLSHFRGDIRLTIFGQLVQPLNGVLRLNQFIVLLIGKTHPATPLVDGFPPRS